MTFFFVLQLAFSAYPCCWKENLKKAKKGTIREFFGKILVWRWAGREKIFRENSKKSEPFAGFLERYLYSWIGNNFRLWKEIIGNNGKNSKIFEPFAGFLERYLFGDDHLSKKKFVKKFKKNPPMGRFLERYLFGDDRDFCWIVKKLKKVQNFSTTFIFFWKILSDGKKWDQQYFPCQEGKNWK